MRIEHILKPFRRLQWKLTLSYTAVTVGSLLVVVVVVGYLVFPQVLIPLQILDSVLTPKAWINIARNKVTSVGEYILSQERIDPELLAAFLEDSELQVTYIDIFRVGDLQLPIRTTGVGGVFVDDSQGRLLGTSNTELVSKDAIGLPIDPDLLPGLGGVLEAALAGVIDPDRLFVTLEPHESFYFAIPFFRESSHDLTVVEIIYFEHMPTGNDIPENLLTLL